MSCDCPSAPNLSGPFFANRSKLVADALPLEVNWCACMSEDSEIAFSTWEVEPVTDAPLIVSNEGSEPLSPLTTSLISGGAPSQLYRVRNQATITTPDQPDAMLAFTFWVWVPADEAPAVFAPCEES